MQPQQAGVPYGQAQPYGMPQQSAPSQYGRPQSAAMQQPAYQPAMPQPAADQSVALWFRAIDAGERSALYRRTGWDGPCTREVEGRGPSLHACKLTRPCPACHRRERLPGRERAPAGPSQGQPPLRVDGH
jgi:hypothetical protein